MDLMQQLKWKQSLFQLAKLLVLVLISVGLISIACRGQQISPQLRLLKTLQCCMSNAIHSSLLILPYKVMLVAWDIRGFNSVLCITEFHFAKRELRFITHVIQRLGCHTLINDSSFFQLWSCSLCSEIFCPHTECRNLSNA